MRAVFLIGSALVAVAGVQLYVLTDHTERLFAWTIDSGLSATFIGAFYFLALAVTVRSASPSSWRSSCSIERPAATQRAPSRFPRGSEASSSRTRR